MNESILSGDGKEGSYSVFDIYDSPIDSLEHVRPMHQHGRYANEKPTT